MFKLLPDESRTKIAQEYTLRRKTVYIMAFITVLIINLVGLLPTFILAGIKKTELDNTINALANTQRAKDNTISELWLTDIDQKLQTLAPALDNVRPAEFIAMVIDKKITGVSLTGFQWLVEKGTNSLLISGIAKDRGTLLNFQNALNASDNFSNVTLPISNLAKDKNLDFQIKLTMKK